MILLIGGMGFIGLNTALRLLECGERVVIMHHSSYRLPDPLKSALDTNLFTARLDVSNPADVFDVVHRHQVDSIINLMAPPARSLSTQADYHLYTRGLENVLQAAHTFGLRRVSLGSSTGVYGGISPGPYHEELPLPVRSPTQVSAFKKAMEIHALHYAERVNLNVVLLRIASIYGPHYYSMHNPISRMCHAAVQHQDADFRDRPGQRLFEDDQADWTYVKDAARGIQLVHTAETLAHHIYNIGSGRATSNKEIFDAVRQAVPDAMCSALTPGRAPTAAINPAQDLSRIASELGYAPEYTIKTGVADYIEWLRSHAH